MSIPKLASVDGGTDFLENDINSGDYTLFERVMYGGMGYGVIVIPTNFVKIICTIIFPPIGEILNIIGSYLLNHFPYITWDTLKYLFQFENLNRIIYSWLLTSMFYVPGLVYTLAKLTGGSGKATGVTKCDPNTGECIDMSLETPIPS